MASKVNISAQDKLRLDDIIQLLPGYDPLRDAEGYWFDYQAAQDAIDFYPDCITHIKGKMAGKPYVLEPHEQALVANIFGWKNADNMRRYKEIMYFVPRKNSKTTWAAGFALQVLFTDHEAGAECYCAAADRDQATLLFSQAAAMVRNKPFFDNRVEIFATSKTIRYSSENSYFRAISSEAASKHGYNSHLVIIDELHAQLNRELTDVLNTSTGSRTEPLVVYITTSDFERPSICNEKHEYAIKVRDGNINDPAFLPAIYEAQREDDWTSPDVWYKANPNLGKSISLEYIQRECKRAQETPTFENTFKRLHLNIRTEQDVRWLQMLAWDECDRLIDPKALEGHECYGGLDLASTNDLASFTLSFPNEVNGYDILTWSWCPEDKARERDRKTNIPYLTWAKEGFLYLTPGNVIDYEYIRNHILEIWKLYDIKSIGYDRWGADWIVNQLGNEGLDIMEYGQGFASMSAPTKELEKIVSGKQLGHGKNPVMRWAASNVTVEEDAAGNLKPNKAKSCEKIDPIVSLIVSIGVAMARPQHVKCEVL